jgi:hypothetical protein
VNSRSRILAAGIVVLATCPSRALAAQLVSGTVMADESGLALADAHVASRRTHSATLTDRTGRFVLRSGPGDTLDVRLIGRRPASIGLEDARTSALIVRLVLAPVPLGAIAVTAPAYSTNPLAGGIGTWTIPGGLIELVPALAEPDPLRSLVMAAPVSFSTPLSGRALLRGYDAEMGGFRLDGHEMTTPFHLGRFFSAIPAGAVDAVTLHAFSTDLSHGDALSGVVDVAGRRARGGRELEVNLSPIAATLVAAHRAPTIGIFAAGRLAWLSAIPLPGGNLPYGFGDMYGRAALGRQGKIDVTTYYASDRVGQPGNGMRWTNALVGARTHADVGAARMTFAISGTRFREVLANGFARETNFDAHNETRRVGASAEARSMLGPVSTLLGASVNRRSVRGTFTPNSATDSFDSTTTSRDFWQSSLYGELSGEVGRLGLSGGVRYDGGLRTALLQPRVQARLPLRGGVALSLGAGVASRSYHLVSDPRSEPELSFYDFWLAAGSDTLPVPVIRHVSLQLDGGGARRSWRLSAYASSAHDLTELRPFEDTTTVPSRQFRRVDGRTFGFEAQIASSNADSRTQFVLIYALAWSSRRAEKSWTPWGFDRRHSLRGLINGPIGVHWTLSLLTDIATGTPFTPVLAQYAAGLGDPRNGIERRGSEGVQPSPIYAFGAENSARGGLTAHGDFSFIYKGAGLWKSHLTLSISILNLFLGPVAPVSAGPAIEAWAFRTPVRYQRAFILPPIPTINVQMRW